MKGLLITFEGGDGAGKTTLIEGVYRHLVERGENVLKTRAPGGTRIGEKIRSLLLHEQEEKLSDRCELFLFLADRAEHLDKVILPALQEGKIVLCDRFNDSTVAYQGVARGLDPQWVRSLCRFATKEIEPSLTFYLDIDPSIGLQRIQQQGTEKDRIESETLHFHERIRKAFHEIAKQDPQRVRLLHAEAPAQEVLAKALEQIYAIFSFNR